MKKLQNPVMVIVGIGFFCLLMTSPVAAQEKGYEALLGEWDAQTEDGQYSFVFVFSMEEDVLKGVFQGMTGDVDMDKLSFEDNELKFTVTIDAGGQSMVIDFEATIEGDSLEGFLSMEYGEANITGKKRK